MKTPNNKQLGSCIVDSKHTEKNVGMEMINGL